MATDDIPSHLPESPQIEEADFIFNGFDTTEVSEIHDSLLRISTEIREREPDGPRYLILGNYDRRPKQRLRQAQGLIEYFDATGIAFLLSDLEVSGDSLDNFYIKYLYALSFVDTVVLVAEDNDGGHELEVGEVQLSDLYIIKREYESASIEGDLEREKYDAMIAKLFEVMDRNEQLFTWSDYHGFTRGVQNVVAAREDNQVASPDDRGQVSSSDEVEESMTTPDGWTISQRQTTVTLPDETEYHVDDLAESLPDLSEYNPDVLSEWIDTEQFKLGDKELSTEEIVDMQPDWAILSEIIDPPTRWIRYERVENDPSDVSVSIVWKLRPEYNEFKIEVNWNKSRGVATNTPINAESLSEADHYADVFMGLFNQYLTETGDAIEAVESAINAIEKIS